MGDTVCFRSIAGQPDEASMEVQALQVMPEMDG